MTPRGRKKQKKWINMVIQFPMFVFSKFHYQANTSETGYSLYIS